MDRILVLILGKVCCRALSQNIVQEDILFRFANPHFEMI